MTKRLVVVSGNIATGKTTLATTLAAALHWHCELESVADNPYLADFYDDVERWSLHTQFHFLGRRAKQHHRAANAPSSAILERSIYEDANVFAAALHETGQLSDRDFENYHEIFDLIAAQLRPPDLVVYLHAPNDLLLKRIKIRSRPFEQGISRGYLETLQGFYDKWVASICFCPVLAIQSNSIDLNEPRSIDSIIRAMEQNVPMK